MNAWIVRTFTVEEKVTEHKAVKAKTEFLGLREDNILKADFQDCNPATFWQQTVLIYPILSDRAPKLLNTLCEI
jgi:hypothetical protein